MIEHEVRIMRVLTAINAVHEDGFESYSPTDMTHALCVPAVAGGFKFM